MSSAWTIELSRPARRQLAKLDKPIASRITRYLFERVAASGNPRQVGEPLTANFEGLWRYRVGDYRVICDLRDDELVVLAIEIGHRKEIYQ